MNAKSHLLLLGIFHSLEITIITVANVAVEANTVADADAAIQPYNDPPIVSGCGQVHIRNKKIVGGHEATFGGYPWHGAILVREGGEWKYRCGSSLLNDRWIVTAAHCLYCKAVSSVNDVKIWLGEWKIYATTQRFSHEEYYVECIKGHPQYRRITLENDIALLKLNRTVFFKPNIIPICLPMSNLDIFGKSADVPGWGLLDPELSDPQYHPDVLQETTVEIITNKKCQEWYEAKTIYDVQICAGYEEGGRDACKGDSGGGLTILMYGKRVLIGVVSGGIDCALPRLPGLYTYVQKFVPWILNIMQ